MQQKWFHALALPGGVTGGRFAASRPQNYTLFGTLRFLEQIELAGLTCCDIGTMDGLAAFSMKQAGAAQVVATDIAPRETFAQARQTLALDIDYRTPLAVADLPNAFPTGHFDLIVCAGVLYHVADPVAVLIDLRNALREGGLLILETQYLCAEARPVLSFSPADNRRGSEHANTFFRPSFRALCGMMQASGFQILASVGAGARITVLARAEKPSRIDAATPVLRRVLDGYRNYNNYNERFAHAAWETGQEPSRVRYAGPSGDYYIYSGAFRTRFPPAARLERLCLATHEGSGAQRHASRQDDVRAAAMDRDALNEAIS